MPSVVSVLVAYARRIGSIRKCGSPSRSNAAQLRTDLLFNRLSYRFSRQPMPGRDTDELSLCHCRGTHSFPHGKDSIRRERFSKGSDTTAPSLALDSWMANPISVVRRACSMSQAVRPPLRIALTRSRTMAGPAGQPSSVAGIDSGSGGVTLSLPDSCRNTKALVASSRMIKCPSVPRT